MMAFRTNAAGPSRHTFSKADAIAQSDVKVGPSLRAPLIRARIAHKLPLGPRPTQPASVGLRGKTANLIDTPEIFSTRGEKYIPRETRRAPGAQGKSQPSEPRGAPF